MKKVFLLCAVASLGCLTVSAQLSLLNTEKGKSKSKLNSSVVARHSAPGNNTVQNAAVIWSDDFSIPANWDITHAPNASTDDWVIGTNAPSGFFPIDPINSASAANGFALFDSDLLCSNDQIANLTTANPIDLTGHADIRLSFSQYYRRFHDSTFVFISTDGSTWTKFEVNGNLTLNQFSGGNNSALNPEILTLDISSVAANQDSIYVRFQFYSPDTNLTNVDTSSGCAYSWMIDDVSISDVPAVDGSLLPAYCGEYSVLPVLQAEAFQMRGRFINTGGSPVTGAQIYFTVIDPNGGFAHYDTSVASGTVNPGDTSGYLNSTGTFAPSIFGLYLVDQILAVPNDTISGNNIATGSVVVDDSTYARDYTAIDVNDFRGTVGFSGSPISFAEKFHIYQNSQFTSVSFYLNGATLGDDVSATVFNTSGGAPNLPIGSTANYTITANDTGGAFLTLPFSTWITVNPGDYFVAINQLDTNNLTLGISNNIYTFHAGYFNLDGAGWNPNEAANLELAFMVRVNNPEGTLNSVKEPIAKSVFNVYPNPTNGVIYITGNGNPEKDVVINIVNELGQVIKSESYGSFLFSRIDLSVFPAGIYTVNVRSASGEENKTIVLQ